MRKFSIQPTSLRAAALLFAASFAPLLNDCVATELRFLTDALVTDSLSFESAVEDGSWALEPLPEELPSTPRGEDVLRNLPQSRQITSQRDQRLIDRVTDPTAWLMDLRMRHAWTWPTSDGRGDSQSVQFRPTIPFQAWGHVNILRVTVPYEVQNDDGAGIGDVQVFDLVVAQESWGRWGFGPSLRLIADPEAGDSIQAGPAAGAVAKNHHWTVGALAQNFLSDDDSQSRLQPILAYKFNDKWSVGIGESEFRYDWNSDRWNQVPLGIELDEIVDPWGQKIQLFVNPQYNFARDESNSDWTLFLGLTLLVPGA
jgi:hypothetical protein